MGKKLVKSGLLGTSKMLMLMRQEGGEGGGRGASQFCKQAISLQCELKSSRSALLDLWWKLYRKAQKFGNEIAEILTLRHISYINHRIARRAILPWVGDFKDFKWVLKSKI